MASVNLIHFAPKAAVLCEITRNDGYWVVQGHPMSLVLVSIESPFLLVNIINLYPNSQRFRVIAVYWLNYHF